VKIINLTAENVKKLKVVDITPTDNFIQVTGPNGSGKTSVLDSIWWALGGKDGIQSVPIRKGAEKARIKLNLGSIVVERKFTPAGTTLTVKNEEGASYPSPQAMLDDLIGSLSFDPLAFARKDPKAQYDELRTIAKVDVDLVALENLNTTDFNARRDLNRDAKAKRAQADGITVAPGTPETPIDESDLIGQMEAAAAHNATLEQRKAGRLQAQADAKAKKAEGVRLREASAGERERTAERIADLEKQIAQAKKDGEASALKYDNEASAALNAAGVIEKKIDEAPPLPDAVNVSELRAALDKAKLANTEIAKRDRRKAIAEEAKALESKAEVLTRAMDARNEQARKALQSATMPVEGLTLAAGHVEYNGLPFEQGSDAEQLRVSISIAMAGNPKLRVIRIRDGSLLDENGLKLVAELAHEKDYQIWIERVGAAGVGIVMEDGEVKA
jgi:hypothetical protein